MTFTLSIDPIFFPTALRSAEEPVVDAIDTLGISLYDEPPEVKRILPIGPVTVFEVVVYLISETVV